MGLSRWNGSAYEAVDLSRANVSDTPTAAWIWDGSAYVQVWPEFTPVTIFDDFNEAADLNNYTITGGALGITSGAVGISGTTDGERLMRRTTAPVELASDDVYVKAVMSTNATRNTSLVFRLSSDFTRYVALNLINGTAYMQRVTAAGAIWDVGGAPGTPNGFGLTTTSGITIEIVATAADNRYRVWRNGSLIFNEVDTVPAAMGAGFRGVGLRFNRSGFANSPRINEMTWADYTNQI